MRRRAGTLLRRVSLCAAGLIGAFSHGAGASPRAVDRSAQIVAAAAKPRPRASSLVDPQSAELRALACAEGNLIDPGDAPACPAEALRLDPALPLPTREDLDDHALPKALRPVPELDAAQIPAAGLVPRYVKFLAHTAQGRVLVRRWLQRVVADGEPLRRALAEAGLPASYAAIPVATSGLASDASWRGGAAGAWGFGPSEGRALGLEVEPGYDERREIGRASAAAARRLHELRLRFGSWPLVLAAQEIGEEPLEAACATVPGARTCEGVDLAQVAPGSLPRPTVRRIARVAAVALLLENLEAFGFDDVRGARAPATAMLEVPAGTSLRTVARAAGTSVRALRALNPAVLGELVGDQGGTHVVRVPTGGVARAGVLLPRLLAGDGDGAELIVGEEFDWGRPDVEPKPQPRASAKDPKAKDAPPPAASPSPIVAAELAPKTAYSKVRAWPSQGDLSTYRVPNAGKIRSLAEIAASLRVSATQLASLNGMALDAVPPAGMWLRVPSALAQLDGPSRRRGEIRR